MVWAKYSSFKSLDLWEMEHGMIYARCPSFFIQGFGNGHVPTFWLLRCQPAEFSSSCLGSRIAPAGGPN